MEEISLDGKVTVALRILVPVGIRFAVVKISFQVAASHLAAQALMKQAYNYTAKLLRIEVLHTSILLHRVCVFRSKFQIKDEKVIIGNLHR